MDKKNSETTETRRGIHRLFEFMESIGVKPARMEKECGLGNGYLRSMLNKNYGVGENIIVEIKKAHPELSLEWLYCGIGPMTIDPVSLDEGGDRHYPQELEKCLSKMYEDIISKKDKEIAELTMENIRIRYELEKRKTISG